MNPLAQELNTTIEKGNPAIMDMLSSVGKKLFFPKGILSQSAEAKQMAHTFNATIGIATEGGVAMHLPSIMRSIEGLAPGESLTYAPSFGLPGLRKKWKEGLVEKNPSLSGKHFSLPVVSQAITHGLALVSDVWVDPGDVILLPDKIWGNYNMIFTVKNGARISQYTFFTEQGGFNLEAFAACVEKEAAENKKIIVLLNFPNNPTGYTPTVPEMESIEKTLVKAAASGTKVIAVSDDAYFGLFHEEECAKESLFARLANAHENLLAIKLDGATKEDYVWGLRVGFVTYGNKMDDPAPVYEALEKKTAGAVRGGISNASHLSQAIVLKAMDNPDYPKEKAVKRSVLRGRAQKVRSVLADPKFADAWEPYPFNSGYFMCLKLKTVDAEELRVHVLKKYGVGLISLGKTDLRVAFSCIEEEDVSRLFDLVLQGVSDLT